MRHPRRILPGLGLLLSLVLGGCGGSGRAGATDASAQTLHAATTGLSYSLRATRAGKQLCVEESYSTMGPKDLPASQTSHSCGSTPLPGHPVLIQAKTSRLSMLTDISSGGCPAVRGGRTPATLAPLTTHCTAGRPQFRVVILPAVRRLRISGVPGARVINFPRHRCRISICITTLA